MEKRSPKPKRIAICPNRPINLLSPIDRPISSGKNGEGKKTAPSGSDVDV